MPSLKDIRRRIASVNKTRQITSAMKLVAGARLRKSTEAALGARPYQEHLAQVLTRVAEKAGGEVSHPLLQRPPEIQRVLAVVLTSDRGLCGPFNNNLLRRFRAWYDEQLELGREVEIRVFGRKGRDFFDFQEVPYAEATLEYDQAPFMETVRPLADRAIAGFTGEAYDEVVLVYNRFVNVLTQRPSFEVVLPLRVEAGDEGDGGPANLVDYQYEPSPERLLSVLLPLFLRTRMLQAFLETRAGEYAARMTAMEAATNNATELISSLTLQYNRARQAAITKEITEIVGGAEAL